VVGPPIEQMEMTTMYLVIDYAHVAIAFHRSAVVASTVDVPRCCSINSDMLQYRYSNMLQHQ